MAAVLLLLLLASLQDVISNNVRNCMLSFFIKGVSLLTFLEAVFLRNLGVAHALEKHPYK